MNGSWCWLWAAYLASPHLAFPPRWPFILQSARPAPLCRLRTMLQEDKKLQGLLRSSLGNIITSLLPCSSDQSKTQGQRTFTGVEKEVDESSGKDTLWRYAYTRMGDISALLYNVPHLLCKKMSLPQGLSLHFKIPILLCEWPILDQDPALLISEVYISSFTYVNSSYFSGKDLVYMIFFSKLLFSVLKIVGCYLK